MEWGQFSDETPGYKEPVLQSMMGSADPGLDLLILFSSLNLNSSSPFSSCISPLFQSKSGT